MGANPAVVPETLYRMGGAKQLLNWKWLSYLWLTNCALSIRRTHTREIWLIVKAPQRDQVPRYYALLIAIWVANWIHHTNTASFILPVGKKKTSRLLHQDLQIVYIFNWLYTCIALFMHKLQLFLYPEQRLKIFFWFCTDGNKIVILWNWYEFLVQKLNNCKGKLFFFIQHFCLDACVFGLRRKDLTGQ